MGVHSPASPVALWGWVRRRCPSLRHGETKAGAEEIPTLDYNTMGWQVVKPALEPRAGGASKELPARVGAGFPSCRSNAACSL